MKKIKTYCLRLSGGWGLALLLHATALSAQSPWEGLQGLQGTWKRFGKPQYETWSATSAASLTGAGIRQRPEDAQLDTTEFLQLVRQDDGAIVYRATVPDQNDGATVDFPLTFFTAQSWTFENPEHDFPQKIEYWFQDDRTLKISVSGNGETLEMRYDKVDAIVSRPATLQGYTVFISSRNTGSVKRFDAFTGQYQGEFGQEQIGGETQEVAIGPDNMLYVTSLRTKSILKYDPATGAYLGPFSSGYDLQKPTKLTFAPDGYVYVSQWGDNQSSVVRFDAQTGQFDRDCTGPLSGPLGHAWDGAGNLYVACFYSKDIRKFSPEGQFLDIAIPADSLKGPSNLWFEPNGDLMVADWAEGAIKRFRPDNGRFIFNSVFASGFGRLEGIAHAPDGFLYACDWYMNLVKKLDASTGHEIGVYLEGNGMLRPNGIAFWKK